MNASRPLPIGLRGRAPLHRRCRARPDRRRCQPRQARRRDRPARRRIHPARRARPARESGWRAWDGHPMSRFAAPSLPVFLLIVAGFGLRRYLHRRRPALDRARAASLLRDVSRAADPHHGARADLAKVPVLAVGGTLFVTVLVLGAICMALRPLLARRFRRGRPGVQLAVSGRDALANLRGARGRRQPVRRPRPGAASVAMVAMTPLLNVLCVPVLARYGASGTGRALYSSRCCATRLSGPAFIGAALNPVSASIPSRCTHADALPRWRLAFIASAQG